MSRNRDEKDSFWGVYALVLTVVYRFFNPNKQFFRLAWLLLNLPKDCVK